MNVRDGRLLPSRSEPRVVCGWTAQVEPRPPGTNNFSLSARADRQSRLLAKIVQTHCLLRSAAAISEMR